MVVINMTSKRLTILRRRAQARQFCVCFHFAKCYKHNLSILLNRLNELENVKLSETIGYGLNMVMNALSQITT